MKYVVFVHGSAETEGGQMPTEAELAEMTEFNEQLVASGLMLGGEGLHPTANAARIDFSADAATITDGPFPEAGEIVAGYWLLQGESLDEIKQRMSKAPFREGSIEIRQIFEEDAFGDEFTPELRRRDAEMRRQVTEQSS